MDALRKSKAVAFRVLAVFLEGHAKDTYIAQMAPGTRCQGTLLCWTWPFCIKMLMEAFLSDHALEEAQDEVARAALRD